MSEQLSHYPAVAKIDLDALVRNAQRLREFAPAARHMGIVKADAYGHGRGEVSLALARAGFDILGIAQLAEALEERRHLDTAGFPDVRIFSWLLPIDEAVLADALRAGIEVSVSTLGQLEAIVNTGIFARIHLKIDTGMGRGGATPETFPKLAVVAKQHCDAKRVQVAGVWSHFARADEATDEGRAATLKQIKIFEEAVAAAKQAGLAGFERHIAATSGEIWYPQAHFDMVRDGIGLYGLSPDPANTGSLGLGFEPVMTLKASLLQVKRVPAGHPVSYGGTWVAPTDRWLGLVPLGYGDGIPRHAANAGPVSIYTQNGRIDTHVVGRVCMDQFVVDLGPVAQISEAEATSHTVTRMPETVRRAQAEAASHPESSEAQASEAGTQGMSLPASPTPPARVGDTVVLFGNPNAADTPGCPLADDWAEAAGTINYEIFTRLGARVPRAYSYNAQK